MPVKFDKLLVLDLDETLIHTVGPGEPALPRKPDFYVCDGGYSVYLRPGVKEFLASCFASFRVGIWTAATGDYAMEILPHLCNPDQFEFVWDRGRCTPQFDYETRLLTFHKDIRKLTQKGYDKTKILCVDDKPANFKRSYGNYIRVAPFFGTYPDPDEELPRLFRYLETLGPVPDVRDVEKRGWKTMSQP